MSTDMLELMWTMEQVLGLAPDKYSLKTSRNFATPERWLNLGQNDQMAWGEFPLKDKPPFQVKINLSELNLACGCASRKFPCYHSLGLLMLLVAQPDAFTNTTPPNWMTTWFEDQVAQAKRKQNRQSNQSTKTQSQREARRYKNLMIGLQELDLWLCDMVRNGFATLPDQSKQYWSQMADRLVDAHASELATEIREMAVIPERSPDWPEQMLRKIGRLHLLIQGFNRFEQHPPQIQADLKAAIGWLPDTTTEVGETVDDTWYVLGRRFNLSGKQKVQRTWLWGENSQRFALIFDVAYAKQSINLSLVVGTRFEGTLCFEPSLTPLRASLVAQANPMQATKPFTGNASIKSANQAFTKALTHNPWLRYFPFALQDISLNKVEDRWMLQDSEGYLLPLPEKFEQVWHLQVLAHTQPLTLFGEWNGHTFHPFTLWHGKRLLELHILGNVR